MDTALAQPPVGDGPTSLADNLTGPQKAARLAGVKSLLSPFIKFSSPLEHAKAVWLTATPYELPDFVAGDHDLVPHFINHMLSLASATGYDDISTTVDFLRREFDSHSGISAEAMDLDAMGAKRAREKSPSPTPQDSKRQRTATEQPSPAPMPTYAWDEEREPGNPSSTISSSVDDFLDLFEQAITGEAGMLHPDAVEKGYFPKGALWVPEPDQATWTEQQCRRFATMQIPAVPLCNPPRPDLLLYLLGSLETLDPGVSKRLKWLQNCPKSCIVNNASGSGKTRLLLEYLCTRWALFFMLSWDPSTNPYGSREFQDALHMLFDARRVGMTHGQPFCVDVRPEEPDSPSQAEIDRWYRIWDNNADIATHVYQLVLLVRLLIYQRFRRLVVNHQEKDSMRAWCLLQVCPAYSGLGDVFCVLLQRLSQLSCASVEAEIRRLLRDLSHAGQIPSALVFDESQVPAQRLDTAFGPTRGLGADAINIASQRGPPTFDRLRRPLLKPIVNSIRTPFLRYAQEFRTFIAGTKLHRNLVADALCSSVAKEVALDDYVEFGAQDSPRRIKAILVHYLSDQVVSHITVTMWEHLNYWLQGRHRFIMTFVFGVLMSGRHPKQMMNVLSNILKRLTGHALVGCDHQDLPYLRVDTIMPKILQNPESIDKARREFLTKSVLEFMIKGKPLKWAKDDQELVSMGLARFTVVSQRNDTEVIVNEHLVLVTLFHWVRGDEHHSPLLIWLDQQMANSQSSSGGFAFEDVILFLLWDWFGDEGRPLNQILDFLSPSPEWAGQTARLISVFSSNAGSGDTQFVDKLHTTEITYAADTARDTLDWFSGFYGRDRETTAPCRCPILKPDTSFGGDVVLGLRLANGMELMMITQCKLWNKLKYKDEIEPALWKISPEGFFQGKPSDDVRKKLDEVMQHFKAGKDFAPRPPPENPDDPGMMRYKGFPPKYRVIRVLAAFRDMIKVPADMFETQAIGCYPFAMLSPGAMKIGGSQFSSFRRAVERAEETERVQEEERKAKERAEAARIQAQVEEDAAKKLRRSVRNKTKALR